MSRLTAFATWLLALLGAGLMYISLHAQYQFILAHRSAAGRTDIAEELRKITSLTTHRDLAGEDHDSPAG
jgi:hypothetical protein